MTPCRGQPRDTVYAIRNTEYEIRNTHHAPAHGALNLVIHFDIFTLFPGMFDGIFTDSILKRAQEAGVLSVTLHNIRDYAEGRHRVTDDTPYGGGGGMVMKPEPISRAVETVLSREPGWRFEPAPGGAVRSAAGG